MATSNKDFRTSGALKILLPGIVLQSVLMGGGYATGREIIEYGGKFGAYGLSLIHISEPTRPY